MSTYISVLPKELLDTLAVELVDKNDKRALACLRLPHPRTGLMSLFLPVTNPNCASSILELQNVAPNASRSWFYGGEVVSDGSMLLLTPVDPVFLLVPILRAASAQDGSAGNFRTLDDILEDTSTKLAMDDRSNESVDLVPDVLELGRLPCVQEAARRICEMKDITPDLVVFRFSHSRLLNYLVKKINRLANGERIVASRTLERELAKDGLMEDGKEELRQAGRLKLACDLVSQYIPNDIHEELLKEFDFSALTSHLAALKEMDIIQGSTSSNNKKSVDGVVNGNNGKKRKANSQESTGVAKLKKANVKGMAKLSTFFQKKF